MDSTPLREDYADVLSAAATPDLGQAADGGWDADHVLAHLLSIDAGIAGVALVIVSGMRPSYDNRAALDTWNLDRIIAEHAGRPELIDHVRRQGAVFCDLADQLSEDSGAVLVPSLLLSNGEVIVDQAVPLAGLINGLAGNHMPSHAQQLRDLRATVDAGTR